METYFELANLNSTSTEAYLDAVDLCEVETYDPATGRTCIRLGEGEETVVRWVSPLRLHVLKEGSVADAIVTRAREAFARYTEYITPR